MTSRFRNHASPPTVRDRVNDVVPGYRAFLERRGLAPSWINSLAGTAGHIVAWLAVNGMDVSALDIRAVADFASHDCACPAEFRSQAPRHPRAWADRFLAYLIDASLAEMPEPIVRGGRHVDGFIRSLAGQGYSDRSLRSSRSLCRHFVVWLHLSGTALDRIDGGAVRGFPDHDCACACPRFFRHPVRFHGTSEARAAVSRFADFLVGEGVVGNWREAEPPAARSKLVEGFLDWMRRHRGAREATVLECDRCLHGALLPDLGDDPALYDASMIRTAFANHARTGSPRKLANTATVLRAWLRYLGAIGACRPELADAVPATRRQAAAKLPRHVGESDIETLVASPDTATPAGLRDRAVMLLLARLALRAGDIAALRLDDIDWERAHIRVNGKSRRTVALPLPQDAGDALAAYILRGRCRGRGEFVFLGSRAPYRALSSNAVSRIVRRAMQRAGIDAEGLPASHVFRHSRATHLLRGGASLDTVAALLRHRSVQTTTLYARVDLPMLLEIAQPWPGAAS